MKRYHICVIEERRRLTAAWLNIVAAGLVSAGSLSLFGALANDGWAPRTERFALVALGCQCLGICVHLLGRALIQRPLAQPGPVAPESMGTLERELCRADRSSPEAGDIPPVAEDRFPSAGRPSAWPGAVPLTARPAMRGEGQGQEGRQRSIA